MKILAINLPNLDLSYFTKRGLNLEVSYQTLDKTFPIKYIGEKKTPDGSKKFYTPDVFDYMNKNSQNYEYSIILIGWNPKDYDDSLKNTGGYSYDLKLKSGTFCGTIRLDGNENKYVLHEIHHLLCYIIQQRLKHYGNWDLMDITPTPDGLKPFYLNDEPENLLSNHAQTWNNIKKFLPELNSISYNKYKYFTEKEVIGLKPELVQLLDKAREIAGIPFVINSGLRTVNRNDEVGGVENSAHLTGEAVDLRARNSNEHFLITKALLEVGFTRISKRYPTHVHCDISVDKPQNVLF